MELAGVIGMGASQEGLRPELLKYILVKDQEVFENEPGKTTFRVFSQSHTVVDPGTTSTAQQGQLAAAVSENTAPAASSAKQTTITDFFCPRPSATSVDVTFISPCPSVRLTEVPVVFARQANSVEGDYVFDPTHPIFEDWDPSPTPQSSESEQPVATTNPSTGIPEKPKMDIEERLAAKADKEADRESEMRLSHEQAMKEMQERLNAKDMINDSLTKFAAKSAEKLAKNLADRDAEGDSESVTVHHLTTRRDALLEEVKASQTKVSELIRSKQKISEELATAVARREDTRVALATAEAETATAKSETAVAQAEAAEVMELVRLQTTEIVKRSDMIEALLAGKGHEVIKGQNRLIHFLRAESGEYERGLQESSANNEILKEAAEAAAAETAEYRRSTSSYKEELQHCNVRISELEANKHELENALQNGTGFTTIATQLRDREKTATELSTQLTARVEEVALLHQLEIIYQNHVLDLQTHLERMYHANQNLGHKVTEMEKEVDRVNRANDTLQQKVTLFESQLEQRKAESQRSKQELKVLVHDLLHRIVQLSLALAFRGAFPFNAAYQEILTRAELVAQVEGEDVYAEANVDGCEHEFDNEEIEQDEEDDLYNEEYGVDPGDDHGNDGGDDGEGSGKGHDNNRGASGEIETVDDRGTPDQDWEDVSEGSQDCEDSSLTTNGKEVTSTSATTSDSDSRKHCLPSAATASAENSQASVAVPAASEGLPDPSETFKAKRCSVLDRANSPNVADTHIVDSTPVNDDTERLPLQDLENTYDDDVKYSNNYDDMVDGAGSSDGEDISEEKDTAEVEERSELVGGLHSTQDENARKESGHDVHEVSKNGGSPQGDQQGVNPSTIRPKAVVTLGGSEGGIDSSTTMDQQNAANPSIPARDNLPTPRTFLTPKKPARPSENLLSTPEASTKAKASNGPVFTQLMFNSADIPTSASGSGPDVGRAFLFGNDSNHPTSLFATPTAKSTAKSKQKSQAFKSFSTLEPSETKTPASVNPEAEAGSEVTKTPEEAVPASTKKTFFPTHPQHFIFGGKSSPVSFTASSPSFVTRGTQTASTVIFSFQAQTHPPVTIQPIEKATENDGPEGDTEKDMPETNTSKEKMPEEKPPRQEPFTAKAPTVNAPAAGSPQVNQNLTNEQQNNEMTQPKETPLPTPETRPSQALPSPSRTEKRAAKQQQKKAAKKAEREADDAKVQERRRVREALMMKW